MLLFENKNEEELEEEGGKGRDAIEAAPKLLLRTGAIRNEPWKLWREHKAEILTLELSLRLETKQMTERNDKIEEGEEARKGLERVLEERDFS